MSEREELLACPFCGETPHELFEKNINGPQYPDHWFVWCENLDCSAGGEAMEETREAAWAAWNTRAPQPATAAQQPSDCGAIRKVAADAIRTFCRSLGSAAVQMSHGTERIYYAGISLDALSAAVALALTSPPSQSVPDCGAEARFLLERLDEFDPGEEDAEREYHGHVAPAIARLRTALSSTESK